MYDIVCLLCLHFYGMLGKGSSTFKPVKLTRRSYLRTSLQSISFKTILYSIILNIFSHFLIHVLYYITMLHEHSQVTRSL